MTKYYNQFNVSYFGDFPDKVVTDPIGYVSGHIAYVQGMLLCKMTIEAKPDVIKAKYIGTISK